MNHRERGVKLLEFIIEDKQKEAQKIVQQGADFTIVKKGDSAIHLAARKGWLGLIIAMKAKGVDLAQANVNGNTAAHYAAKNGFLNIVKYLKESGIDLNACNNEGQAPLHEAVKQQPMDVIENLIDLGMNPNKQNEVNGETPMHTAAIYARQPALEGLLLKGASSQIADNNNKKPEDVAKVQWFRGIIRMYEALRTAIKTGFIQAKGLKLTSEDVANTLEIDRVGIIIETIDIPKEFPATFYCRREKIENSTVSLNKYEDERLFSDVFHLQLSDTNRNCAIKCMLPLYQKPKEKEEMVLRFINHEDTDKPVDAHVSRGNKLYCPVETTLVPETTCVCLVYVRPKREEIVVSKQDMVVTSAIEKDFSLAIPAKAFAENTVLSLKVFNTNDEDDVDTDSEEADEEDTRPRSQSITSVSSASTSKNENDVQETPKEKAKAKKIKEEKSIASGLVTDVFQITITGDQPKKGLTMQMPMFKSCSGMTDLAIVRADERTLYDDSPPEVLPVAPNVLNCNLVFEVSHFSIYVAVPRPMTATEEDLMSIKSRISSAKDKRKAATFFAFVKQIDGPKHTLLVDCGLSSQRQKRLDKWTKEQYETQGLDDSEEIMLTPGETFLINVQGNASFEDEGDSERKLTFSQCRSSFQAYPILLHRHVRNVGEAFAHVCILKKADNSLKEITRFKIQLHVPPPPPTWTAQDPNSYKPPKAEKSPYESLKTIFGVKTGPSKRK